MLQVVLTGGPSSGKTSVINRVVEQFKELGYKVIVVPETATELINSGIRPFGENALPAYNFQKLVLQTQLNKENVAREAAEILGSDKTIILYDRGTLDGYAYCEPEEWEELLHNMKLDKRVLSSTYDAILYLENASKFFTLENNAARYEADADAAAKKGDLVLQSYLSHDNLLVIKPRENMVDKQQEVIRIIQNLLGQPVTIKEQRKFLVESVDFDKLIGVSTKVDITQDYIKVEDDYEYRVRKMTQDNNVSYHFNVQKRDINGTRKVISERTIDEREYEALLIHNDEDYATVNKSRYSFVYADQYYKLDVFEDGLMLLEVNVTKENPDITLPGFVSVVSDVTDDYSYSNIGIARRRKRATYGKRKVNRN